VLSKKIGIDLGTSTVLVYVKGEGVVVNEPTLMATDGKGGRVLAIGRAATQLVGRGGKARTVRPVRDGNGVDYGVAGAMLQHLIGRVVGRQRIFRPDVMLSVGPMVTGLERRAVLEATMQAGAKTAYLIDKPMAAAIGAKVAVSSTDGIVVVNLGAGSTEMAVIVLGEIVAMQSIPTGGEALDRAIEVSLARTRGAQLKPGDAERLKLEIGSAITPATETSIDLNGDGDTRSAPLHVTSREVQAAIREPLDEIVAGLQRLLAQVPETRRAAVTRNGLVLSGGGAQLPGMAEFLTARVGMPARVARDPQSCVAVGTGMALDNMQVVRRGQHYIT
jgi:rod shape-determining protein MreB and related proteins